MTEISDNARLVVNGAHDDTAIANFIDSLKKGEGTLFQAQEDYYFDYKREFPFSLKDDYFYGIIRLISGFHNTYGGIILFGIHDEKRTAGHNKVKINVERLNTRLRELFGRSINVTHLSHGEDSMDRLDLIVVPKRPTNASPISLLSPTNKYEKGTVWLRRGHEVLMAESRDFAFLFGPRSEDNSDQLPPPVKSSAMPPNPSTIKTFVGRFDVLKTLFDWITEEDEPRKLLYGRGGSGKSAVAYEFANIIRQNGRHIKTRDGSFFDGVIYLTAKERHLITSSGHIGDYIGNDFSDIDSLLSSILVLSHYTDEDTNKWSIEKLKEAIEDLFSMESLFIVIDDIDTLTTKKKDAGIDYLYKSLIRSKFESRILYTQRNIPVSIENAIEVSGMRRDGEYQEFVSRCSHHFNVPLPSEEFINGDLYRGTEGIPLIVETVVGLRRTAGSYQKSVEIFLSKKGEAARRYLFQREYNALPKDNRSRYVLATIACLSSPTRHADLISLLDYSDDQISDSMGSIFDIFLTTSDDESGETSYSLNPVTRQFVIESSERMEFFGQIKERVKAYVAGMQKTLPEIVQLEFQCKKHLDRGNILDAWHLLDRPFEARVTENPKFRVHRGMIAAQMDPPRLSDAREDFGYCSRIGYEYAEGMRVWVNMERETGYGQDAVIRICDTVIDGKTYSDKIKAEFTTKKAAALFHKAQSEEYSNLSDAFSIYELSLKLHCKAYVFLDANATSYIGKNYEFCRNTAFRLVQTAQKLDFDQPVFKIFRNIHNNIGSLVDPLIDPMVSFFDGLKRTNDVKALERRKAMAHSFLSEIKSNRLKFSTTAARDDFVDIVERCVKSLEDWQRSRKPVSWSK